ncbi:MULTISPECIES: elongation factor P [unclassified Novosphingobium]|uniref:elongation factor P n=1 Tax=unclassified Novosphingobium TaxID=2644732 RepID=UPI0025CBB0B8|nr:MULTISPECIES: elongation factor P [unclassified Novosphingobium]HQV04153.1 elongation factor P [Novosphingobium sp.]
MLRYALSAALLAASAAAFAVPGGPIDSLLPGAFACELPGDATNAAGYRVDDENFVIANSNSYYTPAGRGIYLLTGDDLVLTSGPKRGDKYRRITDNFLRKLGPDGKATQLRCVRKVLNNSVGPGCDRAGTGKSAACAAGAGNRP